MSNGCHYDTGLAMTCVFSYKVQDFLWLTQSTATSNCDLEFPLEQHALWLWRKSDCYKVIPPLLEHEQNPWGNQAQAACNRFVFLLTPCFCFWGHALDSRRNPCSVTRERSCSSLFPSPSPEALCVCVRYSRIVLRWLERQPLVPAGKGDNTGNKPSTTADTASTVSVCSSPQTKSLSIMQTNRIQVGVIGMPTPGPAQNCRFLENEVSWKYISVSCVPSVVSTYSDQ